MPSESFAIVLPYDVGCANRLIRYRFLLNLYFQDEPIYSIIKYISDKAVIPC